MLPPWGFFGSAAIKPIFSGKCSASRLHFCSFHYYNKPIFIYPNKYIFWKKKVFSCSSGIKFQASDTFWPTHLKNNSSSAVVNRAQHSLSLNFCILQNHLAAGPCRVLSQHWTSHWWWRLFMTLRPVPACSGTVDHEFGSIYSLKKPRT